MISSHELRHYLPLSTCCLLIALSSSSFGQLRVETSTDAAFFPGVAEVIAATPAQSSFGDDATTSLAQSFTVTSAFSLETLFLEYEYDTGFAGDQTVTMSIFNLPVGAGVNDASHIDPPDPGDLVVSGMVTFPNAGGTDTIAAIGLDSTLNLDPGGYLLHFSDTSNPGWEWMRTTSSGGSPYADGRAYENGVEKGTDGRDFSLALSSVALSPLPVDTFSVESGSLLASTTWDNNMAPTGAVPSPNFIHNVVAGHNVTVDGSQAYNGAGVNVVDGVLTYTASAVQLPSVVVAAGSTVAETTTGEFFLGDVGAPELGTMELNGQLTIAAENGADAGLDMSMDGTGTATVNVEAGGTLFLTDMAQFEGTLQFNGSGDAILYEGPTGSAAVIEMNSTGTNRLTYNPNSFGGMSSQLIFNQQGEINHASDGSTNNNNRLIAVGALTANADVTVDLTQEYDRDGVPNERRLLLGDGLRGTANVTVNGTPTDPTTGDATLNEFETGDTDPDGAAALSLATDSYTGTVTLNNFVNAEFRRNLPGATAVVNQNARIEFGHRNVESLSKILVGEVTVNSGASLEVGHEVDGTHVPFGLQLTQKAGQSGDLTLASGSTTIMQISGTTPALFDKISAEGTVTLGGTLELLISPTVPSQTTVCAEGACDYTPADGDTFEIVSIAAETLTGDYDANGSVGIEDYEIWQESFGSELDLTADGNSDGVVDAADYTIWRDNLGSTGTVTGSIVGDFSSMVIVDPGNVLAGFEVTRTVTPGVGGNVTLTINSITNVTTSGTTVPEPSSLLLAGLAAVVSGGLARRFKTDKKD